MKHPAHENYSIIVRRINADEYLNFNQTFVQWYPSEMAAIDGMPEMLDFWDRGSFREAYRYARMWRVNGIARRVLSHLPSAKGA